MTDKTNSALSRFVAFGILDRELTLRESWVSFWILLIFCTVTMYNALRIMPVLTEIGAAYGMGLSGAGLAVSTFSIAGLAFAYPGAWIMHRFGIKGTLLVSAVISIIGTLLGLVSTSVALLLFSRVIEGVACGIAQVIVPNVVPRLFPLEKMGLVMGIWALWVTPGNILAFLTTAPLYTSFGLKSGWALALVLEVVCALALLFFCKLPASISDSTLAEKARDGRVYKHVHFRSAMFVGASMACWGALYGAINTFYPTFLQEVHGQSIFVSSLVPLVITLSTIPFSILFGVLAGKWRARKWFMFFGYVLAIVLYLLVGFRTNVSMASIWVFAILFGIAAGAIPMTTYALIPILAEDPQKADYGTATLSFSLQLANILIGFCGPLIALLGFQGYSMFVIVPVGFLGVLVALFIVSDRRAIAEQEADAELP